jgi:hypothetical protein
MTDTNNFDRTDIIRYRLDQHVLNDLRQGVATLGLDAWGDFADEHEGDTRFGWAAPIDADGQITVVYCPEALSLVTDTLNDEDFIIFMDTLEWMIDKHIVYLAREDPVPDEATRTRLIDDELYDINPEVLAFMSRLQFEFLGGAA